MAKPSLFLHFQKGPKSGSSIECSSPNIVTIGRSRGNTCQIKDASISQKHISFWWTGEEWVVTDGGSSNGSFVNDVKIEAETPVTLNTGDVIKIGEDTTIRAEILLKTSPIGKPKAGTRTKAAAKAKEAAPAKVLSEGAENLQEASAARKLKGDPQEEELSLDDITLRQWFDHTMEQTPKYLYQESEALIEEMKLQSKQFDEYIHSLMQSRDG